MLGGVEMLCRVLVFGGIAATDVAAFHAEAQMDPGVARFEALFAAAGVRFDVLNAIQVRAGVARDAVTSSS